MMMMMMMMLLLMMMMMMTTPDTTLTNAVASILCHSDCATGETSPGLSCAASPTARPRSRGRARARVSRGPRPRRRRPRGSRPRPPARRDIRDRQAAWAASPGSTRSAIRHRHRGGRKCRQPPVDGAGSQKNRWLKYFSTSLRRKRRKIARPQNRLQPPVSSSPGPILIFFIKVL